MNCIVRLVNMVAADFIFSLEFMNLGCMHNLCIEYIHKSNYAYNRIDQIWNFVWINEKLNYNFFFYFLDNFTPFL